ncbi:MAG: beta-ketoacyl-ACP synthase [Methylomonas sp.]|jgi:3-oxoacyl-[acyl-carrier-protein] synthase-1|uniref:beta-ketoacyl-ACP synthase n=1 Tax=Methylomonas sp. TaxID=418 RepID=UPI0025E33FC6|nr:beta-ketoacyl-ACP synthase [Methylomonas sp.]MCK9608894.1 beta-ketoacyl-ACP synthase [Methylomonas sp.]
MNRTPHIPPVAITAYQCVSAAGDNLNALHAALLANRNCLRPLRLFELPFETVVGEVSTSLPAVRSTLQTYACRNARLALHALNQGNIRAATEQAIARHGAARVGVVLGTSTSGIYETEIAYQALLRDAAMPSDFNFLHTHTAQASAEFLRHELGLRGPCYSISTACSSSAKALGAAQRLLVADVCDAVLVAGVDSLCRLTLFGFNSLQLISPDACRPMDIQRSGINIGEAAALLLLERPDPGNTESPRLLAVGEGSDAHHMSAPHPEGLGAAAAMRQALQLADRRPEQIDYINLHATASILNDLSEAKAVRRVFRNPPPCAGVKGLLGHTLGAAGAVEVAISLLALDKGFLPGNCGLRQADPQCALPIVAEPNLNHQPRLILSNAFGFGGNNASVLLEAA